jgi:hypothetical protein
MPIEDYLSCIGNYLLPQYYAGENQTDSDEWLTVNDISVYTWMLQALLWENHHI